MSMPRGIERIIGRRLGGSSHPAETEPCSVEVVRQPFLDKLALRHAVAFGLTSTTACRPINDHVNRTSGALLKSYRQGRDATGVPGIFTMPVIDTRNIFAGTAPAIDEAT